METESASKSIYDSLRSHPTNEIRLALLHPATSEHQDIACDLQVASLKNEPNYEALSYTWGPPFNGQSLEYGTILLSGAVTRATGNLFHALRRLRLPNTIRTLWIDAICINQDDVLERSQQVAMMSQIYAGARRVLVWFGEDSELRD